MDQRTLITGAGGFLGSHVAKHLEKRGHRIAAVGRFAALLDIVNTPKLSKFYGMTLPDHRFEEAIREFRPNLLVHCAGTASVADSVDAPYVDFHRSAEVCAYVLETLRTSAPGCHFILLSSAAVYGNPRTLPVTEDSPLCPISPYGYHKVICEQLADEYRKLHGIPSTVLRIFSAYGEGLRRQVVHDIFKKFHDISSNEVKMFGTGEETRDFIHANDIALITELIAKNRITGVFNTASGSEISIRELTKIIATELKSSKKVSFNGIGRPGDPANWQADVSRLTTLGFRQTVTLHEGVASYLRWYQRECV